MIFYVLHQIEQTNSSLLSVTNQKYRLLRMVFIISQLPYQYTKEKDPIFLPIFRDWYECGEIVARLQSQDSTQTSFLV